MVTATPQGWEKVPWEIMKLEFERGQCKWFEYKKKRRLAQQIESLKALGWNIGASMALKDLEEAGIITFKK